MKKYSQVRYWVDDLPRHGKTTFSVDEAESVFPEKPVSSVRRALARLVSAGKIRSVRKGFYAITLPEYGIGGTAPPIDYIDQLMKCLDKNYYVALLTAASYQGASHQTPQSFQIISDCILHENRKGNVRIEPIYKKKIIPKYLTAVNSRTAAVKVSKPELTAMDLMIYTKRAGGINHVVTVLGELAESLDFGRVDTDFFDGVPVSAIQRLGYILDEVLEERTAADGLYEKILHAGIGFCPTQLVVRIADKGSAVPRNHRWNILINYEPESDL
jgi:predicted transcriptional regulator of viral defense system